MPLTWRSLSGSRKVCRVDHGIFHSIEHVLTGFGAQYVANDTINRPRKPHAEATKAHEAAEQRVEEGGSDVDVNENLQQGGLENGVCGQDEKNSVWSPTSGGAQTSTLHFSTVLFTVFYPSSVKSEQRKKYSELAWIGR